MRYGFGILLGFVLSGVIFLGSTAIKILGFAAESSSALASMWNLFLVWFVISLIILISPLIIAFIAYKEQFKQILLFEIGGVSFFTPFWLGIATELSGEPFMNLLRNGIEDGLPYIDSQGIVRGLSIGPIIVLPSLVAMLAIGLLILRPSFVKSSGTKPESAELSKLRADADEAPRVEAEVISIEPPESNEESIAEMRSILTEIGIEAATIDALLNAGFGNITDLMGTSSDQISSDTGIEVSEIQKLQIKLQKRIWFSGI
ncbi:hypothetical protein EU537_09265 [Candidatus Thorarchaeota archaeon]|nr:MAG: hypothetical protein EU537_09265 [Candidatus Thorarchaeota archaeon]